MTCPAKLYRPEELFDTFDEENPSTYLTTYDARVYDHWWTTGKAEPESILETLARRLHDHGITDALYDLLNDDGETKEVVAIMGGHGMSRDNGAYHKVAKLSRLLTQRGFFMASGGGPGAMEATHLGACLLHEKRKTWKEHFPSFWTLPLLMQNRQASGSPRFSREKRISLERG